MLSTEKRDRRHQNAVILLLLLNPNEISEDEMDRGGETMWMGS